MNTSTENFSQFLIVNEKPMNDVPKGQDPKCYHSPYHRKQINSIVTFATVVKHSTADLNDLFLFGFSSMTLWRCPMIIVYNPEWPNKSPVVFPAKH